MKIKVLMVVPTLVTGGGQKLVLDIASNIDKSKFEVCILSLYPRQGYLFEKISDELGIETIYLDKRKGFGIKIIVSIYQFLKKFKPDVIHTHLYVVPYILVPTVLCGIKKRVHTIHTLAWREVSGVRRIIMGLAYKKFGFVPVAISDYNKASVIEEYKLNSSEVTCIYNGVDTKKFCEINSTINNTRKKIRLISVGRFEEVKNHKIMIEAISLTLSSHNNIELVLVGDGELRGEIENQIEEKELNDYVLLHGVTSNVSEELNKADIYVMSSDAEGLPLSVLEAMACGLPIITTAAGGVVDIVKNGENGLVTPIGNAEALSQAISTMIENNILRKSMGENSRKKSIEFDIRSCVEKYQHVYEYK